MYATPQHLLDDISYKYQSLDAQHFLRLNLRDGKIAVRRSGRDGRDGDGHSWHSEGRQMREVIQDTMNSLP